MQLTEKSPSLVSSPLFGPCRTGSPSVPRRSGRWWRWLPGNLTGRTFICKHFGQSRWERAAAASRFGSSRRHVMVLPSVLGEKNGSIPEKVSLTVSSGVVYLLTGLGESFWDVSGRKSERGAFLTVTRNVDPVPADPADAYSLKSSVHEGVSAWLHHPQLLQSSPDLISARGFTCNNKQL